MTKHTVTDLTDTDLAVLFHARTFDVHVWGDGKKTTETTMRGGSVSEHEQRRVADHLVSLDLLTRTSTLYDKRRLYRYAITDAGRARLRQEEGLPPLTVDTARVMSDHDLCAVWGSDPLATEQLSLRQAGRRRVREILIACGERHTGTGGWHLLPFVEASERLGWVDTARGHAYLSDATLEPAAIEALTAPDQAPGGVASGATHVPAKISGCRRSETPDGWVQLLVDVRATPDDEPAPDVTAELVAWGLVTCYGHRGRPVGAWGDLCEDGQREGRCPKPTLAAIRTRAMAWLHAVRGRLLARAGLERAPGYDGPREPWPVVGVTSTTFPESATRMALRDAEITQMAAAAGEYGPARVLGARVIDEISRTFEGILYERLVPVHAALGHVGDADPESSSGRGDVRAVLRTVALAQGAAELAQVTQDIDDVDRELVTILYRDGAIVTAAGERAGVHCTSPPPRPVATPVSHDGVSAYRVPFGAERPEGYDHCLLLSADHEVVCRPQDVRGGAQP